MPALRFVYLLALVVWLGGLLVLPALASPALSRGLATGVVTAGPDLAALAWDGLLARFYLVSLGCGTLMAVALTVMALVGPRPRPYAPRLAVIGGMLALTAAVALPVAMRHAVNGPSDARVPNPVRLLLLATAVGGLTLLSWEARERP